ncbi:unnamed protein product [Pleuronectes platessa]|uniref:Uncharacterized protein n=1 Tax=Pleuronectes platessa TaxID=8262 RepID=A0A9N7UPN5_PLEPL|nr:unnamed protein product [Pleuronectes platessa]
MKRSRGQRGSSRPEGVYYAPGSHAASSVPARCHAGAFVKARPGRGLAHGAQDTLLDPIRVGPDETRLPGQHTTLSTPPGHALRVPAAALSINPPKVEKVERVKLCSQ